MQLLFCLSALLVSSMLHAQQVTDGEKLRERAMQFKMAGKDTLRKNPFSSGVVTGNTIRILADGMPCVVPDTRGIAAMPNAYPIHALKDPMPGQMPNAWPGEPFKKEPSK